MNLEIHIDKHLPKPERRERVIHAILEAYLPILEHDKIDELSETIAEALGQI